MRILALIRISFIAAGLAVLTGQVADAEVKFVTTDYAELRLAQQIYYNVAGAWFRLPFGYMREWIGKDPSTSFAPQPSHDNQWVTDGLYFEFWMPSLRYVGITSDYNFSTFYPNEINNQIATKSEYVVKASLRQPWRKLVSSAESITPYARMKNLEAAGLIDARNAIEEFGLTKYTLYSEGSLQSYTSMTDDLQFIASCSLKEYAVNPTCDATVWWPIDRLGLKLLFPTDKIQDWQSISQSSRSLVERWRVPENR